MKEILRKPLIILTGTTLLMGGFGLYYWKEEGRPSLLEIHVLSLDGGRAIFIRTPDDKRILINGGPNLQIIKQLTSILPFYSRRIDVVITSNSQVKNVSGLIDVLNRYNVDQAYIPAFTLENLNLISQKNTIYDQFIESLVQNGINFDSLSLGEFLRLDNDIKIDILFPANPGDFKYSKTSAPEMMFKISYGENSVFFIGNATNKIQKYIASTTSEVSADVLIVSHSALPENLSKVLIDKIKPKNIIYFKKVSNKINDRSKYEHIENDKAVDYTSYLSSNNRFNAMEIKKIKIISDGVSLKIITS